MRLILSGGGDASESKSLDTLFVKLLSQRKIQSRKQGKLLYLPIAWKSGDFTACKQWFLSTFSALGWKKSDVVMWTDLSGKKFENLAPFAGIYIGGGNTFYLLHQLRISGFDKLLLQFIQSNKPIYGGSAGAIIFGKSIATAGFGKDSDSNDVGLKNFSGLNLLQGFSVQCHYEQEQEKELLAFSKKFPVIALSARSGLFVTKDKIQVLGAPVLVMKKGKTRKRAVHTPFTP